MDTNTYRVKLQKAKEMIDKVIKIDNSDMYLYIKEIIEIPLDKINNNQILTEEEIRKSTLGGRLMAEAPLKDKKLSDEFQKVFGELFDFVYPEN